MGGTELRTRFLGFCVWTETPPQRHQMVFAPKSIYHHYNHIPASLKECILNFYKVGGQVVAQFQ